MISLSLSLSGMPNVIFPLDWGYRSGTVRRSTCFPVPALLTTPLQNKKLRSLSEKTPVFSSGAGDVPGKPACVGHQPHNLFEKKLSSGLLSFIFFLCCFHVSASETHYFRSVKRHYVSVCVCKWVTLSSIQVSQISRSGKSLEKIFSCLSFHWSLFYDAYWKPDGDVCDPYFFSTKKEEDNENNYKDRNRRRLRLTYETVPKAFVF